MTFQVSTNTQMTFGIITTEHITAPALDVNYWTAFMPRTNQLTNFRF